mmetsp:Transcript_91631/g.245483  ORF Transcript_91631/g.245483 Transcript_91631/m.245483 type:complete len:82 (-) Transcript_91631:18-263(-)
MLNSVGVQRPLLCGVAQSSRVVGYGSACAAAWFVAFSKVEFVESDARFAVLLKSSCLQTLLDDCTFVVFCSLAIGGSQSIV